tara:strand:- start:1923 stop:5006 length:3084 start_codon:yes stop_codon:yes gene_type:complete
MNIEEFISNVNALDAQGKTVPIGIDKQKNSGALEFIRNVNALSEEEEEKVTALPKNALVTPTLADPKVRNFPTTLETTYQQNLAELRAVSEYNRMFLQARGMGKEDELLDYINRSGRVDGLAQLDYEGETALDTIFDVISAGNFASAAFADELIQSGSASDAFKRASRDFANAVGYTDKEAEELTYDDVFSRNGIDFTGRSVVAFVLDVVADPTNLIPGKALVGPLSSIASKGLKKSGRVGEFLNRNFRYGANLEGLKDEGVDVLALESYAEAGIKQEYQEIVRKVDRLTGNMNPSERVLFGLYLDQPEKLKAEAARMVKSGLIPEERLDKINETIDEINKFSKVLFRRERKWGLIDDSVYRENYVHGMEALNPAAARSFNDFIESRGPSMTMPKPGQKAPFQMKRKTQNQEERLKLILDGKIGAKSTELDIANILLKRGFDHTRWVASRKFTKGVLDSDAVMSNGVPFSQRIDPSEIKDMSELKDYIKQVEEANPDMSVFALTKKNKTADGKVVEEIESAYVVPRELVDHMNKADAALRGTEELSWFWKNANALTSLWRGWTTFSPGFHMRNYLGMLGTNWIRGVGAKELKLGSRILGDYAPEIKIPTGTGFMKRHVQALKVQVAAEGAGRLPVWMTKSANKMAKAAGYKDFASVPLDIVVDGKKLSASELAKLAEQYDVPQMIGHMGPTGENVHKFIWREAHPTISEADLSKANIDDVLKTALNIQSSQKTTVADKAKKLAGGDNPLLRLNRAAATIPENNGRIALFLDRLAKGDIAADAALETKKWHFDYRKLTPLEKNKISAAIPFYAWSRFALPRMFMSMLEDPGRMSKIPKLKRAIENYSIDNGGSDHQTPDYYDELQAVQLPFMDNDGYPVYASFDMPWMELGRVNKKDILSALNPALKVGLEDVAGQNFFTGTPIEKFPGEVVQNVSLIPGLDIPLGKSERQFIGNIFPPIERYNFRLQDLANKGQLRYGAVRELGVTPRPLDVRRTMRGRTFAKRQLAREWFQRYEQEQELQRSRGVQ